MEKGKISWSDKMKKRKIGTKEERKVAKKMNFDNIQMEQKEFK
jgi:hypothetical protein